MTPEESQLLYILGNRILIGIAQATTYALLYGTFVLLFSISTATFIRRGLTSPATWAMLIVTIVCFIIATLMTAAEIASFTILVRTSLVANVGVPLAATRGLTNFALRKMNILVRWTTIVLPILSDSVVIWRAWVLFPLHRWIMIVPLTLLLASTGTALAYFGITAQPAGLAAAIAGESITHLFAATLALSIATNAVATLLIAYRLWEFRKVIAKGMGQGGSRSTVQQVLFLLVESGVLYCGLQLVYLILGFVPDASNSIAGNTAVEIFSATYFSLSAMYPTIIVVLVNGQRSFVDTYGMTGGGGVREGEGSRAATIGHLSFAPPPASSSATQATMSLGLGRERDGEDSGNGTATEKIWPESLEKGVERRQTTSAGF